MVHDKILSISEEDVSDWEGIVDVIVERKDTLMTFAIDRGGEQMDIDFKLQSSGGRG